MHKRLKLNTEQKIFIYLCAIIVVLTVLFFIAEFRIRMIRYNFNYDSIKEVTGTVSEISIAGDNFHLNLDFEDGTQVAVNSGKKLKSSIGDAVSVYTDGKHYTLSQEAILQKNTNICAWYAVEFISIFGIIFDLGIICASLLGLFFKNIGRKEDKTEKDYFYWE